MSENDELLLGSNWELTSKRRDRAREIGLVVEANFEAMRSAKPVDPETGEVGTFAGFAGGFPDVRPVYRTESGIMFFVLNEEESDE